MLPDISACPVESMSPSVLIVDMHAGIYEENLRRAFPELTIHTALSSTDLPKNLSHIDVLVAFGITVDDDVLGRLDKLKWVQSLATGVDHFLRSPTLAPSALITSGRGIHGPMMREMVAFQMLSLSHNVLRQVADQQAHVWERRLWTLLSDKTAVIVGIGVSGIAVGELLSAFGMRVIGVTRTPREIAGFASAIHTDRLIEAAGMADYLINILPANPENLGLFTGEVFAAMKPTAFFVNVGRGETVDENALIAALRDKRIAGAALDVFKVRPLPPDSPLWDMPNVVITPQIGGFVAEYEDHVMPIVIDNMRLFLAGRPQEMRNIVPRLAR
jgi:phosphoglycerate dehydrogenase-like enzyme